MFLVRCSADATRGGNVISSTTFQVRAPLEAFRLYRGEAVDPCQVHIFFETFLITMEREGSLSVGQAENGLRYLAPSQLEEHIAVYAA